MSDRDNVGIHNYVMNLFGTSHITKRYQKIIINGIYYIFIGIYHTHEEVPNIICIYIVNGTVYRNTPELVMRRRMSKGLGAVSDSFKSVRLPDVQSEGDDQPLRLEITPKDEDLMAIMKSILIQEETTVGGFKRLYSNHEKIAMNNDRNMLYKKNALSWGKFKFILDLLEYDYTLDIFKRKKESDNVD